MISTPRLISGGRWRSPIASGGRGHSVPVGGAMAISLRILQLWRRPFAGDGDGGDRRKGSIRHVAHRLIHEDR